LVHTVATGTTSIRTGLAVGAAAAVAVAGLAVASHLARKVMGRDGAHDALLLAAATISAKFPDIAGFLIIPGASSARGHGAYDVVAKALGARLPRRGGAAECSVLVNAVIKWRTGVVLRGAEAALASGGGASDCIVLVVFPAHGVFGQFPEAYALGTRKALTFSSQVRACAGHRMIVAL
jgi:hypothetical protein